VFWVNVAVTALLPFMVIVTGLAVPEASPLHPENDHPEDGVVVSWTLEPETYVAWLGALATDP
jgi:hypothetical protein